MRLITGAFAILGAPGSVEPCVANQDRGGPCPYTTWGEILGNQSGEHDTPGSFPSSWGKDPDNTADSGAAYMHVSGFGMKTNAALPGPSWLTACIIFLQM